MFWGLVIIVVVNRVGLCRLPQRCRRLVLKSRVFQWVLLLPLFCVVCGCCWWWLLLVVVVVAVVVAPPSAVVVAAWWDLYKPYMF